MPTPGWTTGFPFFLPAPGAGQSGGSSGGNGGGGNTQAQAVAMPSPGASAWTPAGAVLARVALEPALLATLPGGAHRGTGRPGLPRPYATVNDITDTRDYAPSGAAVQEASLLVNLFGDDADALALAHRVWLAAFNPNNMIRNPFPVDAGYLMSALCSGTVFQPKDVLAPEGTPEFQLTFQMWVQVGRPSPN